MICHPPIILQVSGLSQSHAFASSSVAYRYCAVSLSSTFSPILYVVLPSVCSPAGKPLFPLPFLAFLSQIVVVGA